MWEKLKQLARRYDEIGELLEVPEIYADPKKLRALTREQKELSAVVETYRAYQKCEDDIVQALELVSDPELKDMAQEELNTAKAEKERLFDELRVLLLPRDPNDDKNVIVEIRGGVGGEESALFAADLYRMYAMYAEKRGYRVATVAVEVCTRPPDSVSGTRWTRWTPDSNLRREYAPAPWISKSASFTPPSSVSL